MSATTTSQPIGTEDHTVGDEVAVRSLFDQLIAAWGRGDGTAYGALFTDDADYVAFDGSRTKGRRAIGDWHQQLFDTWLKETRLVGQIEELRFLRPDVALVIATGATIMPDKDRLGRRSIQMLVAIKQDDTWRFAAFQNTRIVKRNPLQWMAYGIWSKITGR